MKKPLNEGKTRNVQKGSAAKPSDSPSVGPPAPTPLYELDSTDKEITQERIRILRRAIYNLCGGDQDKITQAIYEATYPEDKNK